MSPGDAGAQRDPLLALIRSQGLIPRGCTVLCAVSGGADSVYLLHRLWRLRGELGFTLAAAHFNHRLRGEESDRDEDFVRQFVALCCGRDRGPEGKGPALPPVELVVGSGDVAAQAARDRRGLEETARDLRYAFLRRAARQVGADYIATAHTAGDNGETLLLHLVRGAGLRGLTGIAPKRGELIRPLLTTRREEIEAYLRLRGLPWREDSSNRDEAYTRNRLRRRVIPELEALCPGFLARTEELTRRLRADEDYLSAQAEAALQGRVTQGPGEALSLPAEAVAALPDPLAVRAARSLLGRMNGGRDDCSAPHLEGLVALCRSVDPSARLDLPGGLTARREYSRLVLSREPPPAPLEGAVPLSLPGETRAGGWTVLCEAGVYGGQGQTKFDFWLDRGQLPALALRPRRTGDRLKLPGRPGKTVKKWCVDERLPARLRASLPVLVQGDRVAAVGGLGPEAALLPAPGAPAWHIRLSGPLVPLIR